MISSTRPSPKYSCSGSPDMFSNGSTAVADGDTGRVETRGKRRVGDDAGAPEGRDQVVLADHALAVADQVNKKIECLRRNRNRVGSPNQLPFVDVEREVLKQIAQSRTPSCRIGAR